jgi:uncharacterized protein
MSIELRPLGVRCNIRCQYCYQNPQREAGAILRHYDMGKMKAALERAGGAFTLFGGEPLLVPIADLEELWSWGFGRFGHNSIQTNGSLINDHHIELFKRYDVHVGISIDGPGPMNDIRWAGTLEKTRKATEHTEMAIERLCKEGLAPSLIITLHRGNASAEKLNALSSWLVKLDALGVKSARFHILENETTAIREQYALTNKENIDALLHLAALEPQLSRLLLTLFRDMRQLLRGDDRRASCIWKACDPYTTRAVQGIEGNGQRSNCGRTNKEGIDFTKGDNPGFERYLALYQTPQDFGGCSGCRFFAMCKGQCPGTAINGDWRNRTEYCEVWMSLFSHFERELQNAGHWLLSRSRCRRAVEKRLMQAWESGASIRLTEAVRAARGANRQSDSNNVTETKTPQNA